MELLHAAVVSCERCERLREYCAGVAREKRKAFREWEYWGRPVPGFGDPKARIAHWRQEIEELQKVATKK